MTTKPSKTFCILPWVHLSTRPDGSMRPCCTANASAVGPVNDSQNYSAGLVQDEQGRPQNLNVTDFETAWNSQYMRNIRTQMLAGEQPASCLKCYREEAAGHRSKREWETDYWSQRVDMQALVAATQEDGEVPPQLTYIDLRFGSKCQLACVMCTPHDSSGWIKDHQSIYPKITQQSLRENFGWEDKGSVNGSSFNWHKNNPVFWEQFREQMPNMQQIYFAGGESLIIDEHYEILETAIEKGLAKNLELRYNSNGVEWRDDLFDLWKEFKLVRFHYSVDDIKERNEYIRYPSKWTRTEEVFHILDQQTTANVEVTIACAVQALNVYYLPEFVKWKTTQGFKKINAWPFGAGGINTHFVYYPPHMNVKVLPAWFKQQCREHYKEFYAWWEENWDLGMTEEQRATTTYQEWREHEYGIKRFEGILNFMESEDWSHRLPETEEFLRLCDQQRGNSFQDTFPEMKDIFK